MLDGAVDVSAGASLTAFTVTASVSLSVSMPPLAVPPLSLTLQMRLPEPTALAKVLYFRPCRSASVSEVLVVTGVVPSDLNNVIVDGMDETTKDSDWDDSSLPP